MTVMWLLVLLSSVALGAVGAGRLAVDVARQRSMVELATWIARGCLSSARGSLSSALQQAREVEAITAVWRMADKRLDGATSARDARCELRAEPLGTRLDINAADSAAIARLVRAAAPDADAVSLTAALLDWRDADQVERPDGAERAWYAASGRVLPRDGPFRAREELRLVRGFETQSRLLALADVEVARISLNHAPPELLMTIAGLDHDLVEHIIWRRNAGAAARGLDGLLATLPQRDRARLVEAYATVGTSTTTDPDGWLLRAVVRDESGRPIIHVEHLVRRLGSAVAPVRERAW